MVTIIGVSKFHRTTVSVKATDTAPPTVSRRQLHNAVKKLCGQVNCACDKTWWLFTPPSYAHVAPFLMDGKEHRYEFFKLDGE